MVPRLPLKIFSKTAPKNAAVADPLWIHGVCLGPGPIYTRWIHSKSATAAFFGAVLLKIFSGNLETMSVFVCVIFYALSNGLFEISLEVWN